MFSSQAWIEFVVCVGIHVLWIPQVKEYSSQAWIRYVVCVGIHVLRVPQVKEYKVGSVKPERTFNGYICYKEFV